MYIWPSGSNVVVACKIITLVFAAIPASAATAFAAAIAIATATTLIGLNWSFRLIRLVWSQICANMPMRAFSEHLLARLLICMD